MTESSKKLGISDRTLPSYVTKFLVPGGRIVSSLVSMLLNSK